MKILLVMPTPYENGRLGLENVIWLSEPVALTSIAAMVKDEHELKILDLRLDDEAELARTLQSWQPDIVGTTSMTTDAYQAKAILRMAHQMVPGVLTLVGGHMPTLSPEEFDEDYIDVIVQGEGEQTFLEIVQGWETQRAQDNRSFPKVLGLRYRDAQKQRVSTAKRPQSTALDDLPDPDRSLIERYRGRYFYTAVRPMASIFTSRGCSYDCNFCAIWEFYERRTRYLSAKKIVDRMQALEEKFVFFLDDNFLTNTKRLEELCEELEARGVKKYWMTQGRTDFVADHPELMARLAKNGMVGLLSGFESNDDDNLAALRKKNTWDKNVRANKIMKELGIFSTGIFMVRPDWSAAQFESLYEYIRSLDIGIPLITILTPLPGTQLYKAYADQLLTTDHRLFDLLHPVLPTRLPRAEFYREFARSVRATRPSFLKALSSFAFRRRRFLLEAFPGIAWFFARTWRYQRVHRDPNSFLRDEEGLLNGPGAKAGLSWEQVSYPDEHSDKSDEQVEALAAERPLPRGVPRLKIPNTLWSDDLPGASRRKRGDSPKASAKQSSNDRQVA